jgi:D-lactate dehydrogenase (cytochrome)
MGDGLIQKWSTDYDDYVRDESRRVGTAESISFPTAEADVIEIVRAVRAADGTITTQGARTGIVGGAVPPGGHILNLSRMNGVGEIDLANMRVTVQPGAVLDVVHHAAHKSGLLFPPDPTETTATIGGMVASNASGALSFSYGPTRKWVERLRIVLPDGDTLSLRRGKVRAEGRSFSITTEGGRTISGTLPGYRMPAVKSAAGYFALDDMDMVDLFIGMEGTLGIVTEIELRLIPTPPAINGLTVFLPTEESALKFVRSLRGEAVDGLEAPASRPAAIEFFNSDALDLLRRMKSSYSAFEKIPALKSHFNTAVYAEFHGESDEELEEVVMQVMETLMALDVSDDDTWFATTERELEPLKSFRHATPEAVNLLIDERRREYPELVKLGTDMSVPDEHLEGLMAIYDSGLAANELESVIFGHIGDNHVHVNILPRDMDEYARGKELYLMWAEDVVRLGGSVSAEHGIGKLKPQFLETCSRRNSAMFVELDAADHELIQAARDVLKRCYRPVRHTVGAAVRCASGNVYTGVNVDGCGYGPCAEAVAIGTAFSNAESEVRAVVAVRKSGDILSPCGNCRQMMVDYAPEAMVIIDTGDEVVKTQAKNLLPRHYDSYSEEDDADEM